MFNSLTGRVTAKREGSLYLETNGIEWDIVTPTPSLAALPPVGSLARIYTYLHHREDQVRLFGFASPLERALFLDLLKVEGVGPKQAVKIMSGISAELLAAALDNGDVEALSRLPGLGVKTAQKMILALRGKLTREMGEEPPQAYADIVNALVEMGFERRLAIEAVRESAAELHRETAAGSRAEPEIEKELMRLSIVRLSR